MRWGWSTIGPALGLRAARVADKGNEMLRHFVVGNGPPVLLVHGFALDARMWGPQVEALSGTFRVITVELPGFGASPVSAGARSASGALADALNVLVSEAAHVVGSSLGGAVAVDLALAYRRLVRSLTLLDALLLGRASGIRAWSEAVARAKAGEMAFARAAWLADDLFASFRTRPDVVTTVREMVADYSGAHWRGEVSTRFEVSDPIPRLPELDLPALVLSGTDDLPSFRAMSDEYARVLPRATREEIPGAGHLPNLERPDVVNARLARFFTAAH